MQNEVILVGGFLEIIELCEANDISIVGIIDNNTNSKYNYKIIGTDDDASNFSTELKKYLLIITPDKPAIRRNLKTYYQNIGFNFGQIISKNSFISRSSVIGKGSIIQTGVNVSSEVVIGDFVKLNSLSNIMHNVVVGDFTTIAPNAILLGNVNIGKGCYIGANSTVLPNIRIADNVTIGAGAVVTKDIIEQNGVYTGIPARKIR
jgi:sugar O-acyltransferase (sialic acid O-acetyltransferase NeuD family)